MKKSLFSIICVCLLASCGAVTPVPAVTPAAFAALTGTPVLEAAVTHPDLEIITPENVRRIELIERWGKGMVYGVELSPDASRIAVGTSTGVYLYDRVTAKQTGFIDLPIAPEIQHDECNLQDQNVAFSPDGNYLAIADVDIHVWDLVNNKLDKKILNGIPEPATIISEVDFSPDGSRIVTLQKDRYSGYPCYYGHRNFVIYDVPSGQKLYQQDFSGSDEAPTRFHFNRPGSVDFLTYAAQGWEISSVDLSDGHLIERTTTMDDFYSAGAVGRVGSRQEGTDQQTVITRLFDTETKSEIRTIPDRATILPVTQYVLVGQRNLVLQKIDGSKICSFASPVEASPYTVKSFSGDGNLALSWDSDSAAVRVWDFRRCTISEPILFFPEPERKLTFSPDGRRVLTNNRGGYGYFVLDAQTGDFRFAVEGYDADFSAGGKRVAVYSRDYINEYDATSGSFLGPLWQLREGDLGGFVRFTRDGDKALYSDRTGITLRRAVGDQEMILNNVDANLQFSDDGRKMLAFSSVKGGLKVTLRNADTGEKLHEFGLIPFSYLWSPLAVSRDLSLAATLDQDYVYLWKFPGPTLNKILVSNSLYTQKLVGPLIFSPDGRLLVGVGHEPPELLFWDIETGEFLHRVPTTETVLELGFQVVMSPDGRLLATLGNDGTVYVWGVRKK